MSKSFKIKLVLIFLLPITMLLSYISKLYPYIVERAYSNGINRIIRSILSRITGIIPFSVAEILLYLLIIFIVIYIGLSVYRLMTNKFENKRNLFISFIVNSLVMISVMISLFMFLWGFNYNRPSLADLLGISKEENTTEDLINLCTDLIMDANRLEKKQTKNSNGVTFINEDFNSIANRAHLGYDSIAKEYSFLAGKYGVPKGVILSEKMCYTGITGIFIPFTTEANVNTFIPDFMIPATTVHEMAHQRGIARENEANFCAYLACVNHTDEDFQYSGTILALIYSLNSLKRDNYESYKQMMLQLDDGVKTDFKYLNEFWDKYEGKVEEISDKVNDTYLKTNGQKDGVKSYGQMVELLLGYKNK
ncbi:DUF3810 domain-containing protein [Clostridium sp. DL1XJH146]